MRIMLYCQHVLGIGHFFRTLEICRALKDHEVVLVSGGPKVDLPLPDRIEELRLPGLMMDRDFKHLFPTDEDRSLDQVKQERQRLLGDYVKHRPPDLFLVELYPFGRKAFRFELDPILKRLKTGMPPRCRIACSLRDILVEKSDPEKYEDRVIRILNTCFDALLVHADPGVVRLEETFSRVQDIDVPIVYTGFITQQPPAGARKRLRKKLGIPDKDRLIVGSAGGGKVGAPLLEATIQACKKIDTGSECHLHLFSGPFIDPSDYRRLEKYVSSSIRISRFTSDFLSYLAAADLSVSMAGYNTCMNILASGVPALVWPFSQNREQRLRAERLQRLEHLSILDDGDLDPARLAKRMSEILSENRRSVSTVDLDGAEAAARWLDRWTAAERRR